jgi:hypothetical protein
MLASHEVTNYRTAETGLVAAHLTNGNHSPICMPPVRTLWLTGAYRGL